MKTRILALLAAALPLVVAGCATHSSETVASAPPATVVTTAPGATTTTPGTVVTTPGGSSVVVASPATNGVTRIVGRVDEVKSNGVIKVKTTDGRTVKLRVPAATAAAVHEGDTATVDVTFSR